MYFTYITEKYIQKTQKANSHTHKELFALVVYLNLHTCKVSRQDTKKYNLCKY